MLTRFQIDGTLEVISENPASTDKNGYFKLVTAHHRVGDFMLVATNGVQEWRGMIRRETTNRDVILAEPISYETTIATHLYLSALRAGRTEMANYADILENIRAELAVMGYVSGPAFARETLELEHLTPDSFGKESRTP
ncbi:MAG TPA: hypothetical protein VKA68_05670 [bacterium]|nr:hypothetical protein [bacterium]